MTYVRDEKKALSAGKPLGTTVPQDENLPTCALSGLEATDVPHPGASTLFSAPRSKQLGHQGRLNFSHVASIILKRHVYQHLSK